jgi:signal transduction histidine kinase
MRERALAIGGDLMITSEPGVYTSMVVLLPFHSALRPE